MDKTTKATSQQIQDTDFYDICSKVLEEGMVVRNYKTMCELLHEKYNKGNSRKAQLKNWQRYFDYEKTRQKFIIVEIYPEPLPKVDERIHNGKSIYSKHIELLLLDYLSKQKGNMAKLTKKKLLAILGMINSNYMNEAYDLEDDMIDDIQLDHFYQRSYKKLSRILNDALCSLKNRRLVNYKSKKVIKITERNELGTTTDVLREATQDEENIIMEVEREVLMEMGYESIVQVYIFHQHKHFYKKVEKKLLDCYNIHYYYNQIDLWFYHEHIEQAKEKDELKMRKRMLNDEVVNYMNAQADRLLDKYQDKCKEESKHVLGQPKPMKQDKLFKKDNGEVYRYAQKQLAENLLRIDI